MKRGFALFLSLVTVATAMPVHGQSSAEQELKRLEAERVRREQRFGNLLEDADRVASDAQALRKKLVEAADYRDRLEREVEAKESRLIQLRAQEKALSLQFKANQSALEDVVIALLAMERDRPPALAIQPRNAAESARVAILMGEIAPILQGRARQAATQIASLRTLREAILMQNTSYRESNTRLMIARQTIGGLIKERQAMQARIMADADSERARISEIVRRSNDLRDLVIRLGGRVPEIEGTLPTPDSDTSGAFARAMGTIAYPAPGQVVIGYGTTLDSGGRSEGITIRTKLGAQVSAPYDGEIEFAGPFRSYGRVMILNVGGGYHLVLAGMANTYGDVGQNVLAGEPIGEMTSDTRLMPDLYMEVRQQSTPLNPSLWVKRPDGT
jgi:septal ring factor EnvC (AmiA/AmiB activator)